MTNPCLVLGNGPSLKDVPNDVLSRYPSFGSNGILLKFAPTYYMAVNPLAIKRFQQEIVRNTESIKFLPKDCDLQCKFVPLVSNPTPMFSYCPNRWIYEGHTVTFVLLQWVFALGFDTVYMLGVDHKYDFTGQPNEAVLLKGDDPNHFDSTYFQNTFWHNPDLKRSEAAYEMAKKAFDDDGRRIINCTEGTALSVFEKGVLPYD